MRMLGSFLSLVGLVLLSSAAHAGFLPPACQPGTFGDGMICFPCAPVANCNGPVTCTSPLNSSCPTCAPGYWRSATLPTACTPCTPVENCNGPLTCTGPADSNCPTCLPGHYRDAGGTQCPACTPVANCNAPLDCDSASTSRCEICQQGYYREPGGPTTADTCPNCPTDPNCVFAFCTNASDAECVQCQTGYAPNSTGVCEPTCSEINGCASQTCTEPFEQTCAQCESGRYLLEVGDIDVCPPCTPVENCAAATCTNENDSTCGSCQPGYYLTASNTCAACTPVPSCVSQLTCTTANDSVCTECETGYAPGPTGCEPICDPIANCAVPGDCPSPGAGQCDACDSGYYLDDGGTADVCTLCPAIEHCAVAGECTSAATAQCTTCDSGYRLVEGSADTCVVATNDIEIAGDRARFGDLPRRRQALVISYDSAIDLTAVDPTTSGAVFEIGSSATGETFVLELPASGWKGQPGRRFRYNAGGDPRVKVLLVNGRMLRIDLRGTGAYALGEPQGRLSVELTVGDTRFCTAFGGTVTTDDGTRFIARKAPRPATCASADPN